MRAVVSLLIAVCLLLVVPGIAHGSTGWPFAEHSAVQVAFGQSYEAPDGRTCTHRGIDVACSSGDRVLAPAEGIVSFAGRVPGPHGGTVLAVTIETGDLRVSMLPFERLDVAAGESVRIGSSVGTVAAGGDPSSAGTHLHIGVRRADLYIDPLGVLVPPVAASPQPSETSAESAPVEAQAPAPAAQAASAPVASAHPVPAQGGAAQTATSQTTSVGQVGELNRAAQSVNGARAGAVQGADSSTALSGSEIQLPSGASAPAPAPPREPIASRSHVVPAAVARETDTSLSARTFGYGGRSRRAWLILVLAGAGVGALAPIVMDARFARTITTGSRGEVVAAAASR